MNITEFKNKAEFFKKGMIMPNRIIKIVKGNAKQKVNITSNGCYILFRNGVMYVTPQVQGEHSIYIKNVLNVNMTLNPYSHKKPSPVIFDGGDGEFEKSISKIN